MNQSCLAHAVLTNSVLKMAERNSPFAAAVLGLIIEEDYILDRDFIPFLWLVAITMLQDRSRETHGEPGPRIDTEDDLQLI